MLFLSLYTSATPPSGPPSAEHMAQMMKLMQEMTASGVLVTSGGILSRQTGMKVTLSKGKFAVEHGAVSGSSLMPASGYAMLRVQSREELEKSVKRFLEVAGDGTTEIIQLMDPPQR